MVWNILHASVKHPIP